MELHGKLIIIKKLSDIDFLMLENRSYSNGSYNILPIQVRLVSPFFHQLGEHVLIVSGDLMPTARRYRQYRFLVSHNLWFT